MRGALPTLPDLGWLRNHRALLVSLASQHAVARCGHARPPLSRPISRPLRLSLTWLAMPCLHVRAQDQ